MLERLQNVRINKLHLFGNHGNHTFNHCVPFWQLLKKYVQKTPNFKCFLRLIFVNCENTFFMGVGVPDSREGQVKSRAKTGKNAQFSRALRGDFQIFPEW